MSEESINKRLLDIYGISASEATYYWKDMTYIEALRNKIDKATKLQKKLMDMPMLKRDSQRIKMIGEDIARNNLLLKEIS